MDLGKLHNKMFTETYRGKKGTSVRRNIKIEIQQDKKRKTG